MRGLAPIFGYRMVTVSTASSVAQPEFPGFSIPVNYPSQEQYQLWIVDPDRDADSLVDGGVFDIPGDATSAVIPITAKLPLSNPRAFVITLEQPGGVVKSRQEQVVALAKI